jgi:hypothetical protein
MAVHLKFLLIACMLQAGHSISAAADDTQGWFEEDCSGATFHLDKFAGASPGQYLILRLNSGSHLPTPLFEGAGWLEVHGKRCFDVDRCEAATQATIWLNQTKGSTKRISGRYTVNFSGQHLEGRFVLKHRRHKGSPFICE